VARLRREAQAFQKQAQTGIERAVQRLERQLLKQLHAATEEQVRRLERRVESLEKTVAEFRRRGALAAAS
jgi:hypothetical protein